MQTIKRIIIKLAVALLMIAGLFANGLNTSVAYAACLPTTTIELYASQGVATLNGSVSVNIWGYSTDGTAVLPGPVLDVSQGACVQVNLHNVDIPEATSLLFQGQAMIPDQTGVMAGNSATYIFEATNPGTFLYEAGLTPNSQHQVAMGLYGALIVRPLTAGQAYDDPATAYTKESVVVLSELDIALNTVLPALPSANPAAFDMRNYKPEYFLINGKAYPGSASIFTDAGDTVLLRYVNAGLQAHSMSILGLSQTILGQDGVPYTFPHKMVAETIATGQTLDTLVSVPISAMLNSKFALYDANMLLRNNTGTGAINSGFGGMLSFLTVGTVPPPGPDTTGPLLSLLALSPNPSSGSVNVSLSFTANDSTTGGNNVSAASYWVDGGAPVTIAFSPAVMVNLSASIPAGLSAGTHVVSVQAQDSLGNLSAIGTINLVVDTVGPTSSGLSLTPNPSNGSVSVALSFTASDSLSGNSNITAAEYWVDAGAPQLITVASPAPVKILNATIAAGLSAGTHIVSVRSQDAVGNWGAVATINLFIDQVGPTTSGVSASPNPNNGLIAFNTSVQAVRVTASFSDVASGGSNIAAAEGFIDTIGTTGTGFAFVATDGAFSSPAETGLADIPLVVINALTSGNHTIYVHAKDASGNWGAMSTTVLVINRSLYFSTLGNTNPPGVGGTADDADIYLWNDTAYSRVIDVTGIGNPLPSGANVDGFDRIDATHFYMSFSSDTAVPGLGTVQDEDIVFYNAGTWSVYFDGTARGLTASNQDIDAFNIVGSTIYFSTLGNTNPPTLAGCPAVGGTADDADIYSWNGSCFARVWDATAAGLAGTANVDGFVRGVDNNHFFLSFAADTALPVLGTVQDEDVVFNNNGTWIVYFDGTAHGLTSNNLDIDAFDVP